MPLRTTLSIYIAALQLAGAVGEPVIAEAATTPEVKRDAKEAVAPIALWPDYIARLLDGA